jgi:NAD(P) transhydrogenase subunit beta
MELVELLYLIATLLFIVGVKRLSKVKTARSGNALSALGMLIAIVAVAMAPGAGVHLDWKWVLGGLGAGTLLGVLLARVVKMTGMPEMVALLNGLGGAASLLVAIATFWGEYLHASVDVGSLTSSIYVNDQAPATVPGGELSPLGSQVWMAAILASVLVGGITLTGSMIAMGKLSEKITGAPILLPGRHFIIGFLFLAAIGIGYASGWQLHGDQAAMALLIVTGIACLLGVLAVIPIGGADMPVVVSLLNSYSGIAASMAGFVINNSLLIAAGALVGASGLILTNLMCKAMNRSLLNVLVGGFGAAPAGGGGGGGKDEYKSVKSTSPEEAAMILADASSVIFVPGYGMAVAQAQHVVKEMGKELEKRGATVRYAIHPVAGRMPGHMNVLLAEADVPYEQLWEMERINSEFKNTDAVVVIGANDVVNPAAIDDPQSPIAGMPILHVHEARTVLMVKRSLSPGYAGIKNPLFERENTLMCFGDGKAFLEDVLKELKSA